MPRRAARTDANQTAIVATLRGVGCSVFITSSLGGGFGDIVAGRHGVNYLLEIKDGSKPPSARKLTPDEQKFHDEWKGQVCVVATELEALAAVGVHICSAVPQG